ncbi:MAG: TIGR01459 family HAD-type hydrolase [Hyphomicrobiaceae bacterium]
MVPVITSVSRLSEKADAWICDVWGVLHNGKTAYVSAADACRQFRSQGGTVILVTNAPYPAREVMQRLDQLGIGSDAWDGIVTSGDVARALIDSLEPQPLLHLGPDRMLGMLAGIEQRLVPADDAGLVICTGLHDDERESPDDYRPMLEHLARRKVPLICANPDVMVERGNRLLPCAGALAQIYAQLGGKVTYTGKPYPPIYERAIAMIGQHRNSPIDRQRLLAIGDGLRTDMAGAQKNNLQAVYIASALHVAEGRTVDAALMAELFGTSAHPPVAAMARLAW